MDPLNLGTEWLGIHINKQCKRCLKELDEMLENKEDITSPREIQGEASGTPGSISGDDIAAVEEASSDSLESQPEPKDAILETPNDPPTYPAGHFSKFPEYEIMNEKLNQFIEDFRTLNNIQEWSESEIQSRLIHFFNTRKFYSRTLVKKNEDGSNNYDKLIEHMKLLEYILKFAKSAHSALDYVKLGFIQEASAIERARISEEDKKYKPKYKEREEAEAKANGKEPKMTKEEKMIQQMTKMGLSREAAEEIVFAKKDI